MHDVVPIKSQYVDDRGRFTTYSIYIFWRAFWTVLDKFHILEISRLGIQMLLANNSDWTRQWFQYWNMTRYLIVCSINHLLYDVCVWMIQQRNPNFSFPHPPPPPLLRYRYLTFCTSLGNTPVALRQNIPEQSIIQWMSEMFRNKWN